MGHGLRTVRASLWVWPVLAVVAIAGAGAIWGPREALLTIAGVGLLLAGIAIGAQWLGDWSAAKECSEKSVVPAAQPRPGQRHTVLRGARLTGANLANADLRQADLQGADLRGADLSQANLTDANLENARLSPLDEGR